MFSYALVPWPLLSPSPREHLVCCLKYCIRYLLSSVYSRTTQCVFSCFSLRWFNIMTVRWVPVVAYVNTSLLLLAEWASVDLFIHFPGDGHCSFWVFAILSEAAMNAMNLWVLILVKTCFLTYLELMNTFSDDLCCDFAKHVKFPRNLLCFWFIV